MAPTGSLEIGDPCFAKVRGWMPYPAIIVGKRVKAKKTKFSVLFYGTKETGDIDSDCVWDATPDNIKKFVTPKSLLKKQFKLGYEEMMETHEINGKETEQVVRAQEKKTDESAGRGVEEDLEFDFEFNSIFEVINIKLNKTITAQEKEGPLDLSDTEAGVIEIEGGVEKNICEQDGEVVMESVVEKTVEVVMEVPEKVKEVAKENAAGNTEEVTMEDMDVEGNNADNEIFGLAETACSKKRTKKKASKRKKKSSEPQPTNEKDNEKATQPKPKGNPSKKIKSKNSGRNKRSKTLRENELDVNAAFAEKIEIKDDNTFLCKCCQVFITSVKLLARSHAQSCGTKKKLGRHAKRITCNECGEAFTGKANLIKHTSESHTTPSYQCSVCMKRFKYRVYYKRHLKIHDTVTAVVCPFCPKTFTFESYKVRHIKRVHQKKLNSFQNDMPLMDDEDSAVIVINQEEKRRGDNCFWQYEATFPNTEKSKSSSYQSFYSSLGLLSQQDWDDWILASEELNVPFSVDGSKDRVEIAVTKNGNGEEKVVCIGSRLRINEEFVMKSLLEVVDNAVDRSENQHDEGETDDESSKETNTKDMNEDIEKLLTERSLPVVTFETDPAAKSPVDAADKAPDHVKKMTESVECHLCGTSGFRSAWFLKRHISQMHTGSIKCDICDNVFIDKFSYLQHSKGCFFWCGKTGCSFHDKRKARVESHERSHQRDE